MTRRAIALALALACRLAGAAELPAGPFVSTNGKAQLWLKPDIGTLQFDTGAQHASAETATASLEELSAAIATVLAEHGVAESDIDGAELVKKTVKLNQPAADGATAAYTVERHYRVLVRDLERWPDLVAALLARDHVDSLSVSFDRTDSDRVNRELMTEAARDARNNGALLAQSFGRQLGPAVAIARGPLDKVGPGLFAVTETQAAVLPKPRPSSGYAVPPAIPFAQAVTAVFRLK